MTKYKSPRKAIPVRVEQAVLAKSARRCTLCFGLTGDLTEKRGQLAHLDGNRNNCAESNLAWMCLDHHSVFDSKTKQHKNYTVAEVKAYQKRLYALVARGKHLDEKASRYQQDSSADRRTLEALLELFSQTGSMNFIRDNNFAGYSFDPMKLDGFGQFVLRKGPEYEFIDQELESLRKTFYNSCRGLLNLIGTYTFPVGTSDRQSIPTEWEIDQPEKFHKAVSEVHDAGDAVSKSYDHMVRTARRKLLS